VALAGPVSNLLLAVAAAIPVMLGLIPEVNTTSRFIPSAYDLITTFVFFNLILFLFNLIPLFPLDGEKVAMYFLPASVQDALARARRFGPLPLILVVMVLPIMGFPILTWLVFNPATWLARLLLL
jgi:Zn-dependent protease